MAVDLNGFLSMRARLHRYSDAKCFSAWLMDFGQGRCSLELDSIASLEPGQGFLVQVSGPSSCAVFEAELKAIMEHRVGFSVLSPVSLRQPYEIARFRVDVVGSLEIDGIVRPVRVVDVSASGIGLLTAGRLDRHCVVKVVVRTPGGPLAVTGEVRYCKPVDEPGWSHRAGLFVRDMRVVLGAFGVESLAQRAA